MKINLCHTNICYNHSSYNHNLEIENPN